MSYAAKKTESHFRQAFDNQRPYNQQEDESIIINKKPTRKKKDSEKVGEYIDFEELD